MIRRRRAALAGAAALLLLAACQDRRGLTTPSPTPAPAVAPLATAATKPRVDVRWDPKTGRGDVIHHLAGGDLLRTCFQCSYAGYTGGLAIGAEGGSGMALYPRQPRDGYREINVWCAQDESIWDRDEAAEYSWGWSENYGTGRDGRRLELVRAEVTEAGPDRVVLRAQSQGGCYRVTRVATTRAGVRWWVLATRITNACDRPVHFDFFSGEDPWIGRYRSSEGDVGWTEGQLVRHEAAFGPGEWFAGGMYDLGNRALGEAEGSFSNQANAFVLDPATPLPDVVLYANAFVHDEAEVDPRRPLDNQSLTAVNLGWKDRTLLPGEGMTIAMALGLAETGAPGTVPRPPALDDADWSAWRPHLVEGPGVEPDRAVRFAAEHVTLDVTAGASDVTGLYTVRNPSGDATTVLIRYPILVAPDRPAPAEVLVDGVARTPSVDAAEPGAAATVSVSFPVHLAAHGIARFHIRYRQPHRGRTAAYLVTTARRWSQPVGRAVFVVRHPAELGQVALSLAGARIRQDAGIVTHTVAFSDFAPDEELVVRW